MPLREKLERAHFGLVVLFLVTLPFTVVFNSMVIIGLALFSLGLYVAYKPPLHFRKIHLLLALAFYFVYAWGLVNSDNLKPVFQDLEQKASLFIFPIIWVVSPRLTTHRFHWIYKTFILAVLFTSLLTFRHGFSIAWNDEMVYEALIVHRPYLGMYCVMCVFFCLEILQTHRFGFWQVFSVASIVFFVGFLLAILAKMALVCLVLVAVLYVLFRLHVAQKTKILYFLVGGLLVAGILALLVFPDSRLVIYKLISFETFNWEEYNEKLVNSFNIRFVLWGCTVTLLRQDLHWLVGVGKGDAQPLLNACYDATVGPSFFSADSLISHNQYLTSWLNLGLGGLLSLLFLIMLLLLTAAKRKQTTFFCFGCAMVLLMIPESILEVQKGVVFFSFFYSLFLFGQPPHPTEETVAPDKLS